MPTFATPEQFILTIDIIVGDVRITAADRQDTVVEVRPSNESHPADVQAAENTRVELVATGVLIKTPKQRGFGIFTKPGSIDLLIEVPIGTDLRADASVASITAVGQLGNCRVKNGVGDLHLDEAGSVDLTSASGAIHIAKVAGAADVSAGSGKVRIREIGGRTVIKNSNGDILLGRVIGDLRVQAANGDVVAEHTEANVSASTANGDVRVGDALQGTMSLKTAYGEIELGIHPGTAARLDVHTSFGKVRNQMTVTDGPESSTHTLDVQAQNSFGDIIIRRAALEMEKR